MKRQQRRNNTENSKKKRYREMKNIYRDLETWLSKRDIAKYKNSLDGFFYHEDDWMYSGKLKKLNNADCLTNDMMEEIDGTKRNHRDIKKYNDKIRWKYNGS